MASLTFRQATIADLPLLNYISRTAKQHWGYPDEWIEHWRESLSVTEVDVARRFVLVGEEQGRVIGFTKVLEDEQKYEIDHLWVLPEFMGKGYGRQLVEQVVALCDTGEKTLIVVSDPHARGFYEKMGFETYDEVESHPPGRFLPVMRWQRPLTE